MSFMLDLLLNHSPLPPNWRTMRDPELPRTPPADRMSGVEAARQCFLGAIQEGRDVFMPAEFGADLPLSRHLGELCEEARGLLLKAAHEAINGRANTAAELLRDVCKAEASNYADDNEVRFLP